MSWLSLLLALLKIAQSLFDYIERNQLLDAGGARAIKTQMEELNGRVKKALATLASCATIGIGRIGTCEANQLAVCGAWLPILWSSSWPDSAVLQAKQNNAALLAWGCPR